MSSKAGGTPTDEELPGDTGPEDRAKHELTQWLENHGGEVYWEKRNAFDYPTFYIEDTTEKPDLLVEIGDVVLAVETKSGRSKAEVYDAAPQVQGYWFNYLRPNNLYVVDSGDRQLDIDGFVTATKHSIDGHLFPIPDESLLPPSTFSNGRKFAIESGFIPPLEYNMTEQHVRMLWRRGETSRRDERCCYRVAAFDGARTRLGQRTGTGCVMDTRQAAGMEAIFVSKIPEEFTDRNITTLDRVETADFSNFGVYCPNCATSICQLGTDAVGGFEAICPGCSSALYTASAVAVADWYASWTEDGEGNDIGKQRHDAVSKKHLRAAVRDSWSGMPDGVTASLSKPGVRRDWEWPDEE